MSAGDAAGVLLLALIAAYTLLVLGLGFLMGVLLG